MMAQATTLNAGNSGNDRRATVARVPGQRRGAAGHTGKPVSSGSGEKQPRNRHGHFCRDSGSLSQTDAATVATVETVIVGKSDSAPALPSVLDLLLLQRATNDRYNEWDEAKLRLPKTPEGAVDLGGIERNCEAAYDREHALVDLAKCIPARTLGDATAHIAIAYGIANDLNWNEFNAFEMALRFRQLNRCLSSALRVVAGTAGVPIESIGDTWLVKAFDRDFPDMGDRP